MFLWVLDGSSHDFVSPCFKVCFGALSKLQEQCQCRWVGMKKCKRPKNRGLPYFLCVQLYIKAGKAKTICFGVKMCRSGWDAKVLGLDSILVVRVTRLVHRCLSLLRSDRLRSAGILNKPFCSSCSRFLPVVRFVRGTHCIVLSAQAGLA